LRFTTLNFSIRHGYFSSWKALETTQKNAIHILARGRRGIRDDRRYYMIYECFVGSACSVRLRKMNLSALFSNLSFSVELPVLFSPSLYIGYVRISIRLLLLYHFILVQHSVNNKVTRINVEILMYPWSWREKEAI